MHMIETIREKDMTDDILDSETFWEGVKKVGPGSEFRYRCIFDPTPVIRESNTSIKRYDESPQ